MLTNDRVAVENAIADSVPLDKLRAEIEKINEYDLPKDERTPSNIKNIIIDIIRKHTGV